MVLTSAWKFLAIWISQSAGGYGWFVDGTPFESSEFGSAGSSPALGRVDLLTVLEHEMGHALGLDHTQKLGDLMEEDLAVGMRRAPDGL